MWPETMNGAAEYDCNVVIEKCEVQMEESENVESSGGENESIGTSVYGREENQNDTLPEMINEAAEYDYNVVIEKCEVLMEESENGDSSGVEDDEIGTSANVALEESSGEEHEQIETNSNADEEDELEIVGRRIVDLLPFVEQLRRISLHNDGNCAFSELKIQKEIRIGFHSKIIFDCNDCNRSFRVYTNDDEKTTETIDINSSAVLGANMVGIGYSQLEQLTSVLDVPAMCNDKYKKLNDKMGEFWEETAEKCMREAAEEEARAAIARGDVDPIDGIPFITVVTDECWSKRSYNKNFTALSGVGAIVGAYTGKVLWIGVRNRYCVRCVRAKNKNVEPPPHSCTKNFTGPSSEMEWETILEGFKSSVELYNLRYLKFISDGDSSTYAKLLENKPYGDRHIEKIECTNHLHRNYRKNIEASVKGCPRGLNRHVVDNLERIRKDIYCAVEFRKKEKTSEAEKISLLKSDLNNILHHVFGDHSNCPTYIKSHCTDDRNYVPALEECNTFEKMSSIMRQLMYCAKDLIQGETNNAAEHYNSIVAKFVGGKRVNFSLSNSYKYRANAAAVQYNTKKALSAFYNAKFNQNPPELAGKLEMKRLQKTDRAKERRKILKQNKVIRVPFCRVKGNGPGLGPGYGPDSQKPDLSDENFQNEKQIHFEKLAKHHKNRISVEANTRDKQKCKLWNEIVPKLVLSQDFGSICKARALAVHVKQLTQRKAVETKTKRHHNESQPVAMQQLGKEQNISFRACGLYIDDEFIFLAASPTGMVNDSDMIVEIRCPLAITNMDPNDVNVLGK